MRAAHFLDMFAAEVFHLEATAVDRHWFSLPRRGLKALCGKFSGLRLNCGGPSLWTGVCRVAVTAVLDS